MTQTDSPPTPSPAPEPDPASGEFRPVVPVFDPHMEVTRPTAPVSVVILALNEEINIADCLASCRWCDDVHVLDSGSTDRTMDIARAMGASVYEHPFESFGEQRNWAIDNIPVKHDWIFHLDADERFTEEVVTAMRDRLAQDPPEAGFHLPQKLMLMGRWLKRSGGYPTYQMRLFHKQRMRFCDYGHGQRELTDGKVGVLDVPYLHYSFSKGLYDWLDKHNRYSSLEALRVIGDTNQTWSLRDLFSKHRVHRWRAWKVFSYHLPFRASLRWLVILFVMGGILEGRAGWFYARLIAIYEQMITQKLRLLRSGAGRGLMRMERDGAPPPPNGAPRPIERLSAADNGSPYNSAATADAQADAVQLRPESSPWTFREKARRAIWMLIGKPIFRASFHNWHGFRTLILRAFGAKIGNRVAIRPTANVEVPWMLEIDDEATIGDSAILYSLGKIRIGKRSIISQYAHLCAGTHDYTDHTFKLIRAPINIGDDVWVGADAFVGPGVNIGNLAVLGARSSAYKDLPPNRVCVGNPAKPIRERELK